MLRRAKPSVPAQDIPDRPNTMMATRRGQLLVFLTSWTLLSALSILWALATPLAAAPDEPAHIVKAASVVRGQFAGPPSPEGSIVFVPKYVAYTHAQTCYAANDEATANCVPEVPGDPMAETRSNTTAGLYNPVYYILVGWPTLIFGDSTGVFGIRIVSALISSVFFALVVTMISTWRHRALPYIAVGAAMTPMLMFLNGSVNPNSLEISATFAAFTAVVGVIAYPNPSLLTQRTVIAMVSAAIAANTRGLSPLWLAVAILAPFLLASRAQIIELWQTRVVKVAIVTVGTAVAAALIWLRLTNSLSPPTDLPEDRVVPYFGASPITGFFSMLFRTGEHLRQIVGAFGWLDTAAPLEVYIIWTLLVGALVTAAFVTLRGKQLRFVLVLVAAFLLIPAVVQAAFIPTGGWIWQGRYAFPLFVIALLGAAVALAPKFEEIPARSVKLLVAIVSAAWAGGQLLAFGGTIHRYSVGEDDPWLEMFRAPQWQPPGGTLLSLALFIAIAGATAMLGYHWATRARSASLDSADTSPKL